MEAAQAEVLYGFCQVPQTLLPHTAVNRYTHTTLQAGSHTHTAAPHTAAKCATVDTRKTAGRLTHTHTAAHCR